MSLRTLFTWAVRELRGGGARAVLFVLCLAIGVAAVVAVAGLSRALDAGIRREARTLLGADLALISAQPIPAGLIAAIDASPGWDRSDVITLATMAATPPRASGPGPSRLVALKVVDQQFPYYGALRLEPDGTIASTLDPGGVIVAPELLPRLGLQLGDRLRIGSGEFTIRALVREEPGRVNVAFSLGPRVFLSHAGFARTGLQGLGTRVDHRVLLRAPRSDLDQVATLVARLTPLLPADGSVRIESFREAQPALRSGLLRTERFLGLVALVSLLVGGVGVAQTVRAWLAGKIDALATLKVLGLRPREAFSLFALQTALLALLGSLVGAVLGTVALSLVPSVLSGILPQVDLDPLQPAAIARGIGLGVGIALLFSIAPLARALRVPALRALRADVEPLPTHPGLAFGLLLLLGGGLWGIASAQARSSLYGALFTLALALAALLLALAARALQRLAEPLALATGRFSLRQGLKALSRPGAGTIGAIVGLGLGVTLVATMYLVHSRLERELRSELPEGAPTAFLVDIQPDQWPALEAQLSALGATRIESVPFVSARLTAIDGVPVRVPTDRVNGAEDANDWVRRREQNLSSLPTLPPGNELIAGQLWSDPARAEVSIETEFARDLGVGLGQTLRFSIQGVPLDLTVTSLRSVDWKTFGINFFLVVEPGVLDQAPQNRVAACRLPTGQDGAVQDALAATFPNVTLLSIREILDKVTAIFARIGLAVRVLGSFTVLAGVAILGGAISAGAARRGRDVALLKTLGMTRAEVIRAQAVEFALAGAVAGLLGALSAATIAWGVLRFVMELPLADQPGTLATVLVLALSLTITLATTAGLLASLGPLRRKPLDTLRAS